MGKYKFFELAEFVQSSTAKKLGIDNTPSFENVSHLDELVAVILDPLRADYGMPVFVSSGFRCPALNKAVGGVDDSVHQIGYAVDLTVHGSFKKFCEFVVEWFRKTGTKFDQILIETNVKTGAQWLHIGMYNNAHQQRGQISSMQV